MVEVRREEHFRMRARRRERAIVQPMLFVNNHRYECCLVVAPVFACGSGANSAASSKASSEARSAEISEASSAASSGVRSAARSAARSVAKSN